MKPTDLDVSRETRERLEAFCRLVLTWNSTVNLISRRDEAAIWERHVTDSLQLAALIPRHVQRGVDLGSGGGFPGLVLAICTGLPFDLVEADQRKAAFLREAARVSATPITIYAIRAENLTLPPADLVTSRALAPLDTLVELALPFLSARGICLFPKGRNAEVELTSAAARWQMRVIRHPSQTGADATILEVSDISHVGHRG